MTSAYPWVRGRPTKTPILNTKSVDLTITLYKAARRVRVQTMSHDLSDEERNRLKDAIVHALKGNLVSRHSRSVAQRLPSPLESSAGGRGYWPSWLQPPGFEPEPRPDE